MNSDVGGTATRFCSVFQTIMFNPVKAWASETFLRIGIGFDMNETDPFYNKFIQVFIKYILMMKIWIINIK